jgi:hypothetical protein
MTPVVPTASSNDAVDEPFHFTSYKFSVVFVVIPVQVVPFGEIINVPLSPTAIHDVLNDEYVILRKLIVGARGTVSVVQVTASGDVSTVAFSPTATYNVPLYATDSRLLVVPDV